MSAENRDSRSGRTHGSEHESLNSNIDNAHYLDDTARVVAKHDDGEDYTVLAFDNPDVSLWSYETRDPTGDGLWHVAADVTPLELIHVDTCLPCFWQGDGRMHMSVPVHHGMTVGELREALALEINAGYVARDPRDEEDDIQAEALGAAMVVALDRDVWADSVPAGHDPLSTPLFLGLPEDEPDDAEEMVYAYFVFDDTAGAV